ncbi:MAG: hypothetical protein NVS4B6_13840 [Mycobacterium sp.]
MSPITAATQAPAVEVDRVAGKQSQEQLEAFVGDLAAAAGVDTHVFVFLWAVADPEHVVNSAIAEVVQHGHVFGQSHRVVQRQHGSCHQDVEHRGSGGDRRSQH